MNDLIIEDFRKVFQHLHDRGKIRSTDEYVLIYDGKKFTHNSWQECQKKVSDYIEDKEE